MKEDVLVHKDVNPTTSALRPQEAQSGENLRDLLAMAFERVCCDRQQGCEGVLGVQGYCQLAEPLNDLMRILDASGASLLGDRRTDVPEAPGMNEPPLPPMKEARP